MSGQKTQKSALWIKRESIGYSRETVVRRPELDPPITSKTLERWERELTPVKRYRLTQLAAIYECDIADINDSAERAKAAA